MESDNTSGAQQDAVAEGVGAAPAAVGDAGKRAWGALRRLSVLALLAAALVTAALVAAGAGGEGGRVRVDEGVFESDSPVRIVQQPEPVVLFDQSLLPSTYDTPYRDRRMYEHLKIVRPYDGASFPANIAPPKVRWEDRVDNVWRLTLQVADSDAVWRVVTDQTEWRPDAATWGAIKRAAAGRWLELEVRGCLVENGKRVGQTVYVDSLRFRISEHAADPVIVYPFVSPLFHALKAPSIYYRDIRNFENGEVLPGEGRFCTNCHCFPGNPDLPEEDLTLAIAVRAQLGLESGRRILGLYNFSSRQGRQVPINSFFMSWDPDGRKIAVTGGKVIYSRPLITLETQEFYVLEADLQIVDARTGEHAYLPGDDLPEYMECFPTWSPDGKTIVFSRDVEFAKEKRKTGEAKYGLYRIPYNEGKGGVATPVPGAHDNGLSNFAPRYSPDGKWVVFNKGDVASLVKPRADLWILSTEQGATPRELECNTAWSMDSHHSWSSNSRWLLFSAKRDDGIFARMYITEIDERGHASPPVEVPTLGQTMLCYNVPEFVQYRPAIDAHDVVAKTSHWKAQDARR